MNRFAYISFACRLAYFYYPKWFPLMRRHEKKARKVRMSRSGKVYGDRAAAWISWRVSAKVSESARSVERVGGHSEESPATRGHHHRAASDETKEKQQRTR